MRARTHLVWVLVVCIVSFGALGGALWANWSPHLGLDLEGGLQLTYAPSYPGISKPVSTSDINTTIGIISNRVDALGVSQPNIFSQGGDIVVQLPGVKDVKHAETIIGSTAQLLFRPILCQVYPYEAPKPAKGKKAPAPLTGTPPACKQGYTSATWQPGANDGSNPPPIDTNALLSQYQTTPADQSLPDKTVINAAKGSAVTRFELGPSTVKGNVVASANAVLQNGDWGVQVGYTSQGASEFNTFAAAQYHKDFAIDLDGQVLDTPLMAVSSFPNGSLISPLSQPEAHDLALELAYGALPVQLNPVNEESVSPTLGKSSLEAGMLAGLLGLLAVMGYTIFYYRGLGVVVVLGLATTAAFMFGLISWMGQAFGQTLDLSGVTGLIVSVGITVDSYVVFFERLKDEIRHGRSVRTSVDRAFARAFKTVLIADAVSLIGAFVLWFLSVGAVKGFAFFLGISTMLDIVTAYTFTRPLVILLGRSPAFTNMRVIGVGRGLLAPSAEPA